MEKDFNEVINNFISWNVRKGIEEDISEEEFNKLLEKRKFDIVENIERFTKGIDEFLNNGTDNPFMPIILMMLFPNFNGEFKAIAESKVGKKLSEKEFQEYTQLLLNKSRIDEIIKFLEENSQFKVWMSIVDKNLLESKELILPLLKELSEKLQNNIIDNYGIKKC